MKKVKVVFGSIIALILMVTVFSINDLRAATQMPEFSLKSVRDGSLIQSDSYSGKVLLITFFATWCPPCVQEIPVLVKLQEELEDAGFSVIGMSVDQQGPSVVAKFVEERGITYPVLLTKQKTTMDFGGVYGIPVAFLVNKNGKVVKKYTGYIQHAILEKDVKSLLN